MKGPAAIHRCHPPADRADLAGGEMWYCPDCGRGWEPDAGGDWTPAGRSVGDDRASGPTSGFIALPPGVERAHARLIEGNDLAESLVGMDVKEAVQLAAERGFDPQVIPHTVEAVTADLRFDRIRLFLDEAGAVQTAWAG